MSKMKIESKNFYAETTIFSFKFNVIKHLNGVHDIVSLFYLICVLAHQKFSVNTRSVYISKFFMTGFEYKTKAVLDKRQPKNSCNFYHVGIILHFIEYENRNCMNCGLNDLICKIIYNYKVVMKCSLYSFVSFNANCS